MLWPYLINFGNVESKDHSKAIIIQILAHVFDTFCCCNEVPICILLSWGFWFDTLSVVINKEHSSELKVSFSNDIKGSDLSQLQFALQKYQLLPVAMSNISNNSYWTSSRDCQWEVELINELKALPQMQAMMESSNLLTVDVNVNVGNVCLGSIQSPIKNQKQFRTKTFGRIFLKRKVIIGIKFVR